MLFMFSYLNSEYVLQAMVELIPMFDDYADISQVYLIRVY